MEDKEIRFIAEKYRKGSFSVEKGWRRLNIKPIPNWKRLRIVACIASVIVLSATAAILYHKYDRKDKQVQTITEQSITVSPQMSVRVIDFESTPLPIVVSEIKKIYGVEISNVPQNAEEYNLSLHYEGTASDLISIINDIFGTEMVVKE